jgi:alkylation response protein AidB-like acyl-CoA dehydrogenase
MARHFIDLAGAHVAQRWPLDGPVPARPGPHRLLQQARHDLAAAREVFHARLDGAWAGVCAGLPLPDADAQALLAASQALVQTARRSVDELYPCCGLQAAHEASALNRVWRDLHTATQHALLTPQ